MPEVSRLYLDTNSSVRKVKTRTLSIDLYGFEMYDYERVVLLEEHLPLINFLADNMTLVEAYLPLKGTKDQKFFLTLWYREKNPQSEDPEKFTASLPAKHKMTYPQHIGDPNEWQVKLKELLTKLELSSPVA